MAEESKSRSKVERVSVHVRIRPFTQDELSSRTARETSVDFADIRKGNLIIKKELDRKQFNFDSVFDDQSEQTGVYDQVARPVVNSMLQGYNATIFAYGQTGTGKTHTMIGGSSESRGVIPRAVSQIFEHIASDPKNSYLVQVGFLQIYMEMFQDLLNPDNPNPIRMREDPEEGLYLAGLTWVPANNEAECMELLYHGDGNRNTAFTSMNSHSSRSHAVYMLKLEKRAKYSREELEALEAKGDAADQSLVKSILYLVDLAGSERASKSRAVGSRLDEAKNINLALLALGNCIQALADKKSKFVPFRDSKLTRLLEDSLGGNSKTSLIVTVGPSVLHTGETISSLLFGSRAMKIENRPEINKQVDYKTLCAQLQTEIDRINDGHGEVFLDKQQFEHEIEALKRQVEELTFDNNSLRATVENFRQANPQSAASLASLDAVTAEKHREIEALKDKVAAKEQEHSQFLEEIDRVILEQEGDLNSMRGQLGELQAEKKTWTQERKYLQDELEGERADRERRIMELSSKLDEAKKLSREAKEIAGNKVQEIEALRGDVVKAKKQAQADVDRSQDNVKRLQIEVERLRKKLEAAQTDFNSQLQKVATEQREGNRAHILALEAKDAVVLGFEEETKRLSFEKEHLVKKVKEREDAIRLLKKRTGEKEKALAALREAKGDTEVLAGITSSELAAKDRAIDELTAEIRGKEEQAEALKQQVEALEGRLFEEDQLAARKTQQLRELDRELGSVKAQLDSAVTTVKTFEDRLKETELRLQEAQEAAEYREKAATEIEACLKAQLADLQTQMELETTRLQIALAQELEAAKKLDYEFQALKADSEETQAGLSGQIVALQEKSNVEKQRLEEEMRSEVETVSARYDSQALELKSHYSRELIQTRKQHEEETRKLQAQMMAELEDLKGRLAQEHSESLRSQEQVHEAEAKIKQLTEERKAEVSKMREDFEAEKAGIAAHNEELMFQLEQKHQEQLSELQRNHKQEIEMLADSKLAEIKHIEDICDEKVERLRDDLEQVEADKQQEINKLKAKMRTDDRRWNSKMNMLQMELEAQTEAGRTMVEEARQLQVEFVKQLADLEQSHRAEVASLQREIEALERSAEARIKDTEVSMQSDGLMKHQGDLTSLQVNLERTQQTLRIVQSDLQATTLNYEGEISRLKAHQADMLESITLQHADEMRTIEASLAESLSAASSEKARIEVELKADLEMKRGEWEALLTSKSNEFEVAVCRAKEDKEEIERSLQANISKLRAQYDASLIETQAAKADSALAEKVSKRSHEEQLFKLPRQV
jgi:chromosome segregation ATPase